MDIGRLTQSEPHEQQKSWRTLEQLAKLIGIVWALVALGVLGYFASLGLQLVRS